MNYGPTGTITFLATDIQGSTEMWERYPSSMPSALERHDALLRSVVEEHGGKVFKNVGDGVFTAFDSAPQAVAAALAAQRQLTEEEWSTPEPLRVRMAIHSGEAEARGGDYFGIALNRVARILAAGHGGQVLLSQAVERLVSERFPEGVALRDLGLRSLKDLTEPERVFQLVMADLPDEFPPLNTLDARPNNLPAQATAVVGRSREIEEVRKLVLRDDARVVTLTGPSGTGKTRLGIQVAAEIVDAFEHGVFLVDLAVVREPDRVAMAILEALEIEADGADDSKQVLGEFLSDRQLLLVLDNFEQVLAAAPYVADLLRDASRLTVLVTSQAPLRIRGEQEYPVPPLSFPNPQRLPAIEKLTDYESVVLFTERARAVLPSFQLSEGNAPAVAEIVHQLDGLPLAIELAAARVKMFPPQALVRRLGRRFDFLTSGTRDLPDRQRTLRGALLWSYNLLSEDEKALFLRQAVFDGGFTIEAAEKVCVAEGEHFDVVEVLSSLVDKSLLRLSHSETEEPRFERLRTIRDFSIELLEESGEADRWRKRHAEAFATFAEMLDPSRAADPGGGAPEMLAKLAYEYENIRTALHWTLDTGEGALAVRLSQALPAIWFRRGFLEDGRQILEKLEAQVDTLSPLDRAHAINLSGRLAQMQGDNSPATMARFEESLALYREAGHDSGTARALMNIGNARSRERALDEARALFEEALALYEALGDSFGVNAALMNLGDSYLAEGEIDQAETYFRQARDRSQREGNKVTLGFVNQYLGVVARQRGDLDVAQRHHQDSYDLFTELGAQIGIAWSQFYLAGLARSRGEGDRARKLYCQALAGFRELRVEAGIGCTLSALAGLEAETGQLEVAVRLLGAANRILKTVTMTRSTLERGDCERILEVGRDTLGEETLERLLAEGRALELDALDQLVQPQPVN